MGTCPQHLKKGRCTDKVLPGFPLADNYIFKSAADIRIDCQIYLSTTVHASSVSLEAPQRCVVFRSFLTYLGMLGTLAPQTAVEL